MQHKLTHSIITLICSLLCLSTQAQVLSDQSHISLLTCSPGQALYERYGHTAILVEDSQQDIHWVFNYGMFDFNTEHFYYKFVKGQTYYELGIEDYTGFNLHYAMSGRDIYEQELNLTLPERQALLDALIENYEPQHRSYLYNFVFDNCATRPLALIRQVLGDSIHSCYRGYQDLTYREFLQHYTGAGSWADFGINMLFGYRADQPMRGDASLFLPEEVMKYLSSATRQDGARIVRSETIGDFTVPATPWYATWYFGLVVFMMVFVLISRIDRRRKHYSWWADAVAVVIYLVCLGIVVFLTHFSIHPLVGYNWRLIVFPIAHLCARLTYFIR